MKNFVISAFLMALAISAQAQLRLPHILSDNMVLQAETEATLWGWADAGSTVSVATSWGAKATATAGSDGRWHTAVLMPKAGYTPLSITFKSGKQSITLDNILSGEVWVCAGQSNMEMPVEGFGNCPVEGYHEAVMDARQRQAIRFVKIPSLMRMTPQDDADCRWEVTTMESVRRASATGYFFARTLHDALDVPVGLVMANKGGTRVESWLSEDNLRRYTDESLDSASIAAKYNQWNEHHRALLWGNGTFSPILPYTVRGIIYYQGCSNVGDKENQYSERLAILVEQWRAQFAAASHTKSDRVLPFYFVEIAPYWYDNADADWGARLREQQLRASQIIPSSALVCTNDLAYDYERKQIHPCQKRQVGERLAWHALVRDYGVQGIMCNSPQVREVRFEGSECVVSLKDDYDAVSRFDDVEGFELAGEDRVFHPATATHNWQRGGYIVSSPDVPAPVAVRYCFKNFQLGNVANRAGLPLFPYRSDNW